MTIGKRIGLGFSVLIILLIFVAGFGFLTIENIARLATVVKENTEENMFMVEKEVDHLAWVQQLDMSLLTDQEFSGQLDPTRCSFGKWLYGEGQNISDQKLKQLIKDIEKPHLELHKSAQAIIEYQGEGENQKAIQVYQEETVPSLTAVRTNLNKIRNRYDEIAVETVGNAAEDMAGSANNSQLTLLIIGIISTVIGIILAVFIARQIIKVLKNIIAELSEGADQVAAASDQLSSSSQQLAEGSAEQASSLEETSSTLEESASMVNQNTANTKQAAILGKQSKDAAVKGNEQMKEMVTSMTELKDSSDEISKIIKVIDDIAFQTNILALNAAVEAARAGDAGMGFAVVADEVRDLAGRSAKAASDTASIIERNILLAEAGIDVTDKVKTSLQDINEQVRKVNELMDEIAAASEEQSQGISQINKAVSQMDEVVQENAAAAEESSSAAEELAAQAKNMKNSVSILNELVNG